MSDHDAVDRDLDDEHARPPGADDDLVAAVGKVSEAMEWIERARGRLFDLHQYIGRAHLLLEEAAADLAEVGADESAQFLRRDIVGRNVLAGRWTFQIVEEFDAGYYADMRAARDRIEAAHLQGRSHVFEAEMKQRLRTPGRPGHEATPDEVDS